MAFWLTLVTVVASAVSLFSEANRPLATTMVTWFSDHHTLSVIGASGAVCAVARYISLTLER